MGRPGLEHTLESTKKTPTLHPGDNESGNIRRQEHISPPSPQTPAGPTDPDLARVVEAWAKLPEAIRSGIAAMVRASI
ncbi:MAG: hypothetical protein RBS39_04125 [Phycisphaerales bacterium]|jgi:hypothetical protein|nr:hypothetical protein [Phycisphaerales bacterium]